MREIFGHGGGEPAYTPPQLFPMLRRVPQGDLQHRYICEELLKLQHNGQLYVTDLLAQPSHTRDMVCLALTGQTIDPESHRQVRAAEPVPPEIMNHMVRVRCVRGADGEPRATTIKYKQAVVKDPRGRTIPAAMGVSGDGVSWRRQLVENVNKWVDWETDEASMPLPEAVICLAQAGKFCRPAKSINLQSRFWLFEEADHPANKRPEGVRPKRGRPPKEATL